MPAEAPAPLLEMRGIEKRFGAVHANRGVDLALGHGEILGLLGENGAGKTTLMNVLFGIYSPDAGSIRVDGRDAGIRGPADALARGIGMVHQHFHLVPRHTVLENLMVGERVRAGRAGALPRRLLGGMLDRAAAAKRLADMGARFGLRLDPDRRVGDLAVGEQQRLEIVKALFRDARILILDEPTSVLTPQETEGLFEALRAMAGHGVGVIFITHKLNEVRAVTSRITVMRAGSVTATLANDGSLDNRRLAELMCGRDLSPPAKSRSEPGRVLLRLGDVHAPGAGGSSGLAGVTLDLRAGEILGVAGVSGNGQLELAEIMGGVRRATHGRLEVGGAPVARPTPRRMRALGVASIPEDRLGAGLLGALPLSDSMVLPRYRERPFSRFGLLRLRAVRAFVEAQMARYSIRAAGPGARTGTLSGGNLQKALLARELAFGPTVLVAAQPTRGLDVSAREFVHRQLLALRERGGGVVLVSEDLEEILEIADRVAVMYEGRVVGLLPAAAADPGRVGLLMAGVEDAA